MECSGRFQCTQCAEGFYEALRALQCFCFQGGLGEHDLRALRDGMSGVPQGELLRPMPGHGLFKDLKEMKGEDLCLQCVVLC